MEDFAAGISQMLSNPEAMSQLQGIAAALGLGGGGSGAGDSSDSTDYDGYHDNPDESDTSDGDSSGSDGSADMLMGMLSSLLGNSSLGGAPQQSQGQSPSLPFDINSLVTIQKAMSAMHTSNKNVELLKALKPHLSDARKKKIDDAVKIMQLINVLPLIKESGLFGLGGD